MLAKDEESRSMARDFIVNEAYGRIDVGTAQAQAFADDMFRAMVDMEPAPHDAFPLEAADARVRSAAVHLFGHGDADAFAHALESFISKEVRGAASNAIAENVEKANE